MDSSTPTIAAPDWCEIRGEYFPPENCVMWTFDGRTVRKGIWNSRDPSEWDLTSLSFDPGTWKDEHGEPITVTHWLWMEDSPYFVPAPPLN